MNTPVSPFAANMVAYAGIGSKFTLPSASNGVKGASIKPKIFSISQKFIINFALINIKTDAKVVIMFINAKFFYRFAAFFEKKLFKYHVI